jgi:hypothetical protein
VDSNSICWEFESRIETETLPSPASLDSMWKKVDTPATRVS